MSEFEKGRLAGLAEAAALVKAAGGADMIDHAGVRRIWAGPRRLGVAVSAIEQGGAA